MQYTSVRNVLNKYSVRTPVKCRKTAVYSCNCTITSQDFVSTAFFRYSAYPYSAVFCTAFAVYSTVVSPTSAKPHFHAILCHRLGMFWQKYSIYIVLHDYYKAQANFVTNCENE